MENDDIKPELTTYMWHIGRILTELMIISDSTDSPIIVQTYHAGTSLFDTLGKCIYNNFAYNNIFPQLNTFIESLDYDSKSVFDSILGYAHDFCIDFLKFLEENNLKK